jgi:nucleotide-binding universal stress UspA family protein
MSALKLLLATDGSENALRGARHVAELARRGLEIEVVLCNVQPPANAGAFDIYGTVELAERQRTRAAAVAFAEAGAVLRMAHLAPAQHVAAWHAAREILAAAEQYHCDGIVMGHRGLGALAGLLGASVSSQVVRRATIPVTLVK